MKSDDREPPLTASQVKALLLLAADARLQAAPAADANAADVEGRLADLSRATGGSDQDLLATAIRVTTPVPELTRIKEIAKVFIKAAEVGPDLEAARLLYHATVANAFVHHAAEISGRPMQKQQDLYARFAESWAGHPIGALFRTAVTRLARTPRDPR